MLLRTPVITALLKPLAPRFVGTKSCKVFRLGQALVRFPTERQ